MRIKIVVLFAASLLWPLAALAQVPVERPNPVAPSPRPRRAGGASTRPAHRAGDHRGGAGAEGASAGAGRLPVSLDCVERAAEADVRDYRSGTPVRREAFALVFDRPGNRTFEAIVDLGTRAVTSMKQIEGAQPAITFEELDRVPALVRADAAWQAAMRKPGHHELRRRPRRPVGAGPARSRKPNRGRSGGRVRSPISRDGRRTSTPARSRASSRSST